MTKVSFWERSAGLAALDPCGPAHPFAEDTNSECLSWVRNFEELDFLMRGLSFATEAHLPPCDDDSF